MNVRVLLAIGIGATATTLACAAIPDLSFIDASAPDSTPGPPGPDGAAPPDDGSAPADGTTNTSDANADATADGATDSGPKNDSGVTCPPMGAPAVAQCCSDGVTPCVGLGCQSCTTCNCPAGDYCCGTKNAAGHIKTSCSSNPLSSSCALM
jgi:hypothetical protein